MSLYDDDSKDAQLVILRMCRAFGSYPISSFILLILKCTKILEMVGPYESMQIGLSPKLSSLPDTIVVALSKKVLITIILVLQ